MAWLLAALVLFGGLTGWAFYATQHAEADDFGAVVPLIFCGAVTLILGLAYLVLAMWNHRFL